MNKKSLFLVGLLSLFLCENAFSVELRPFAQAYAPMKITILKEEKGVKSERETDTDIIIEGGLECMFTAEFAPMHYGFGLAYKTPQKEGSTDFVPASAPIWGTLAIGSTNRNRLLRPFLALRLGYLAPLTTDGNWWEKPINFLINAGLGCTFPYDIDLEVMYDYTSMQKSYEDKNLVLRVNSPRIAARISIGFELSHDRIYDPNKVTKKNVVEYKQDNLYSSEYDEFFTDTPKTEEYADPFDSLLAVKAQKQQEDTVQTQEIEPEPSENQAETWNNQPEPANEPVYESNKNFEQESFDSPKKNTNDKKNKKAKKAKKTKGKKSKRH